MHVLHLGLLMTINGGSLKLAQFNTVQQVKLIALIALTAACSLENCPNDFDAALL